jgi:hypothetical protein
VRPFIEQFLFDQHGIRMLAKPRKLSYKVGREENEMMQHGSY